MPHPISASPFLSGSRQPSCSCPWGASLLLQGTGTGCGAELEVGAVRRVTVHDSLQACGLPDKPHTDTGSAQLGPHGKMWFCFCTAALPVRKACMQPWDLAACTHPMPDGEAPLCSASFIETTLSAHLGLSYIHPHDMVRLGSSSLGVFFPLFWYSICSKYLLCKLMQSILKFNLF